MSPLALVSVSDKTNIIQLSKVLVEKFGYKIISSGGTADYLINSNIPVLKVSLKKPTKNSNSGLS